MKEEEWREVGGGGGMYDLTAHLNEYIKAYFGALCVPPEPGHYGGSGGGGGGGTSLFFPRRRAPLKAICPVAGLHPAAEP